MKLCIVIILAIIILILLGITGFKLVKSESKDKPGEPSDEIYPLF